MNEKTFIIKVKQYKYPEFSCENCLFASLKNCNPPIPCTGDDTVWDIVDVKEIKNED